MPRERPLVAAVIYNRLRVGMPLGIDATIRYGLASPPTQAILQSQLDTPSPYNTRCSTCTGLPPTPIANPGLASMQARAQAVGGDLTVQSAPGEGTLVEVTLPLPRRWRLGGRTYEV